MELIKIEKTEKGLTTTSLNVAEVFGKDHKNVLKDIEGIQCSEEFSRLNFQLSEYISPRGKTYPMYKLTRDGLSMVVFGYTGSKAIKFKEDYLKAFNMMESKLSKILSPAETLLQIVQGQVDQERKNIEINNRMDLIEARQTTRNEDYFTVAGYCSLKRIQISQLQAAELGRKCAKLSREKDYTIETVPDARFGKVNIYHTEILQEIVC